MSFLELLVDGTRYAIPIDRVEEVVPRVWTVPLAGVSDDIEGVFAYRGATAVAIDLRRRLGHAGRDRTLDDHFVVLRSAAPRLVLAVDRAAALRDIELAAIGPSPSPHARLEGAVVLEDGLVLLVDVGALLSPEERGRLDAALAEAR